MTRPVRRPLTADDPIEDWNAAALELGGDLTGRELRAQTMLADRIMDEIFKDGLPPGEWTDL